MKEIIDLGRLSFKTNLVKAVLRRRKKRIKDEPIEIKSARESRKVNMTKICGKPLKNVRITAVDWTQYPAYFYEPGKLADNEWVVLYLHGGAYIASDIDVYNGFVSRFADGLGLRAYSFDYPLSPEVQAPVPALAVAEFYKKMLENGHRPEKIILAGDSAGGGLSLSACFELQKENLPLPGMLLLFSPWVDLTLGGESIKTNAATDLMVTSRLLKDASAMYAGKADRSDPGVSPLFGNFKGFPPVYILAAYGEMLRSECEQLHDAMEKAAADVYLSVWLKAEHAFIVGMHLFPEGKKVFNNLKNFVKKRIAAPAE